MTEQHSGFRAIGQVTLEGDGRVIRHIRVAAPEWRRGATAPTPSMEGIVPTLGFSNAQDDEAHFSFMVPFRMEAASTIEVSVDWTYDGVQDNGKVLWKAEYINLATGETVAGATTTITKLSAGTHLTGKMVKTTLTTGIAGSVAGDDLAVRLYRESSDGLDTLATFAELIQVHFHITMDKLGKAI